MAGRGKGLFPLQTPLSNKTVICFGIPTFATPLFQNSMRNWTKSFSALLLGALALASCGKKDEEPRPDVSSIQVPLRIRHFEKDLFALDTANIGLGLKRLEEDDGEFAELFFTRILPARDSVLVPEGPERFIK
ncbi:MAG: hypothetical protein ACKOCH_18205, partial [Bacteroidota bacterium]